VGSIVTLALVILCWPLFGWFVGRLRERERRETEA
jgi:hypothetical protein